MNYDVSPILLGAQKIELVREYKGLRFPVTVFITPFYMEACLRKDMAYITKKSDMVEHSSEFLIFSIVNSSVPSYAQYDQLNKDIDAFIQTCVSEDGEVSILRQPFDHLTICKMRYAQQLKAEALMQYLKNPVAAEKFTAKYARSHDESNPVLFIVLDEAKSHLAIRFELDPALPQKVTSISIVTMVGVDGIEVVCNALGCVLEYVQWVIQYKKEGAHALCNMINNRLELLPA